MAEVAEQPMEATEETSTDAMLDELVSVLPEEGDDLSVEKMTEEGMEEEMNPEPQEVATPSDEVFVDLYETIYGEPLDESEQSEEQMQDLQELVMVMPELAAALASGDIGPAEAALMIFREASNVA
tara:strand:- start:229 stop:606 length:378 start_codon:yes stop_codon:yes gene_type:complete